MVAALRCVWPQFQWYQLAYATEMKSIQLHDSIEGLSQKIVAIHYITLHYITLHYITLHYITLHYITLHYITLHYITLHYITLHYITLHYITLHYITSNSDLDCQGHLLSSYDSKLLLLRDPWHQKRSKRHANLVYIMYTTEEEEDNKIVN